MNAAWDAIMATRTAIIGAMDQNMRIREEMQRTLEEMSHNHERLEAGLARLDALVGARPAEELDIIAVRIDRETNGGQNASINRTENP